MVEVAPVPASSGNKNVIIVLVSIIVVLLLFTSGYFILKNQSLEKSVIEAKDKSAELEKDIIYYKGTNFVKEAEILRLKLDATEKELAVMKTENATLKKRIVLLEANAAKMKPYVDAFDAIQGMFFGDGPSRSGVRNIDAKITVVNDTVIQQQWDEAKAHIDLDKLSWDQRYIGTVVTTLLSQVRNLLP